MINSDIDSHDMSSIANDLINLDQDGGRGAFLASSNDQLKDSMRLEGDD